MSNNKIVVPNKEQIAAACVDACIGIPFDALSHGIVLERQNSFRKDYSEAQAQIEILKESNENWMEGFKAKERDLAIADKALLKAHAETKAASHEKYKLGYTVVNVIGAIETLINNAQEIEIDDLNHKHAPIDLWHELETELEKMPVQAELFESKLLELEADNARLREALKSLRHFKYCDGYSEHLVIISEALAIESPSTALQEYRDNVIEKCAGIADQFCIPNIGIEIRELKHD